MDDWRIAYQQTGKPYIEPLAYIPIPGSIECRRATKKDEPENSEDCDERAMLQDWML